jgi:hypothetical protein
MSKSWLAEAVLPQRRIQAARQPQRLPQQCQQQLQRCQLNDEQNPFSTEKGFHFLEYFERPAFFRFYLEDCK